MPEIRADFTKPAVVAPGDFRWISSPGGEVERVLLDRIGDEVAVATSLVRYPRGSRFPAHEHELGEEYLVLEGEFADDRGRYPPGTYVRNPPGSRHTPFSDTGCVIWVKLRQFHPDDQRQACVNLEQTTPAEGVVRSELHRFQGEVVATLSAAPGAAIPLPAANHVQEVLVIEGAAQWEDGRLDAWGWARWPAGQGLVLTAASACRLLHKTRPPFALP